MQRHPATQPNQPNDAQAQGSTPQRMAAPNTPPMPHAAVPLSAPVPAGQPLSAHTMSPQAMPAPAMPNPAIAPQGIVPPVIPRPAVQQQAMPAPPAPQMPAAQQASAMTPPPPAPEPAPEPDSEPSEDDDIEDNRQSVRRSLAKRLSDVICIPASQLTPQERHMAGDVLVEMLREADSDLRESVAKRLVMLNEAPRTILVLLAKDKIEVARHVLENSKSLTDSDLIQIARKVSAEHRKVIAQRRHVSDAVVDVIVEFLEEDVVETLLNNKGANFSETALQRILTMSRSHKPYIQYLIKREELRPSHGLTMFWWAEGSDRKKILARFAVTRNVLQDSCWDLYPKAAKDGWQDASVRKALQFIERRQRNRAAIARSKYENLESAIDAAEVQGITRELTEEISYMAGIKPATGAQILTDKGGEGIAILCKAPGLKRDDVVKLWKALRRPVYASEDVYHPDLARVIAAYDAISTDKAQTVLRYWNWSLTSSLNPEVLRHIRDGVIPKEEDFGAAAITAALVFGNRYQ